MMLSDDVNGELLAACKRLLSIAESAPVKHPQQAEWREQTRAAIANAERSEAPRPDSGHSEKDLEATFCAILADEYGRAGFAGHAGTFEKRLLNVFDRVTLVAMCRAYHKGLAEPTGAPETEGVEDSSGCVFCDLGLRHGFYVTDDKWQEVKCTLPVSPPPSPTEKSDPLDKPVSWRELIEALIIKYPPGTYYGEVATVSRTFRELRDALQRAAERVKT